MTFENFNWLSYGFLFSTAIHTIVLVWFIGPKIRAKEERIWAIVDGYKEMLDVYISRKSNLQELKDRMEDLK